MKRFVVAAVSLACLSTGLASVAQAQTEQDMKVRGYVGVGGGLAVPIGDLADETKLGWIGHLFGGFTSRQGLLGGRVDASYGQNKIKGGTGGTFKHLGATANLVVTPGHRPAKVHPYFLAGAGVYNVKATGGTAETKLALNGGAGVQWHLGHQSDFFVEARFLSIRSEHAANLIPITVGLRWGGI